MKSSDNVNIANCLRRKKFVCDQCASTFYTKHSLNVHQKFAHKLVPQDPFVCSVCGKTFTMKKGLTRHTKSVHGVAKSFSCTQCGKSFPNDNVLQKHMLSCSKRSKSDSSVIGSENINLSGSVTSSAGSSVVVNQSFGHTPPINSPEYNQPCPSNSNSGVIGNQSINNTGYEFLNFNHNQNCNNLVPQWRF